MVPEGTPVATKALPSDHSMTCWAVASNFLVGLEIGKITGRSVFSHIASTTSLVKAPGFVEVPTKIVGFTVLITSRRLVISPLPSKSARFLANGF